MNSIVIPCHHAKEWIDADQELDDHVVLCCKLLDNYQRSVDERRLTDIRSMNQQEIDRERLF